MDEFKRKIKNQVQYVFSLLIYWFEKARWREKKKNEIEKLH